MPYTWIQSTVSLMVLFIIPEDAAAIIPNSDTERNKSMNLHYNNILCNICWIFPGLFL
jgi:hypothetical protein